VKYLPIVAVALIVAAAAVLGYAAWSEINDPGRGTITEKKYRPAYTTTQCHQVGKTTVCTPVQHAECYLVRYTDGKHDGDACVPALEYDRYRVGDWYPAGAR
jgi:hypothetical protein